MNSHWQNDAVRVSTEEADQLVDMWLRRRLSQNETAPAQESGFTLREIAQALGAREEDVAILLGQIRAKSAAPTKVRPAIPVKQSWRFIALIYGGAFVFLVMTGVAFAGMRHARFSHVGPLDRYHSPPMKVSGDYVHGYSTTAQLPMEFGFQYLGESSSPYGRSGKIDWVKGEKAIIEDVSTLNSEGLSAYVETLSEQEIHDALAISEKEERNVLPPPGYSQRGAEPLNQGNSLIQWHRFTLNVDNHRLSTVLPSARVSNPELQKAVDANIKKRIEGIIAAMKQTFSTAYDPDLIQ